MTIIATDGKTIAADGLATAGSTIVDHQCKKLIRRGGRVYGVMGLSAMVLPLIDWIEAGADPQKQPKTNLDEDNNWSVLVAGGDGVWLYTDTTAYREAVALPFAFGYGADEAMLAMRLGMSPKEAVAIACEHNVYIGGEIQSEQVEQPVPEITTLPTPRTVTLSVSAGSFPKASPLCFEQIVKKAAAGVPLSPGEGKLLQVAALGESAKTADPVERLVPRMNGSEV